MSTEDIGTPKRPPPPTITQPSDENTKISFDKQFVTTIPSLLLLALTVSSFAGWVSAAAAPDTSFNDFSATRSGYLFFFILGFFLTLFLWLINALRIVDAVSFFKILPWNYIMLAIDGIWSVVSFIFAIVTAVRESQVFPLLKGKGAFGSASFFAFVCTILYLVHGILLFLKIRSSRRSN